MKGVLLVAKENKQPATPEQKNRRAERRRWIAVITAGVILLFGIFSLVMSMHRRAVEAREAEIEELRFKVESETDELKSLQKEYDTVSETREDLQKEYDEAREKHDAGMVETSGSAEQSLEELKAAAEQAKQDYSAALAAYDASVDQVEQNAMGYDDAKASLETLKPFVDYAASYEAYVAGTAETLPGLEPKAESETPENPDEPETTEQPSDAQPSDAQAWYDTVVFPAAANAGIGLPPAVEGFPTAVQALTADPTAKVEAYENALKASKDAEQRLADTNAKLESTAKAYADGKNAQRSSEDWLSDTEIELDRLSTRMEDLQKTIDDLTEQLEKHQAELKELET